LDIVLGKTKVQMKDCAAGESIVVVADGKLSGRAAVCDSPTRRWSDEVH
jgi:hypothetical protein